MCKCALFPLLPYLPFSHRYNSQFLMPGLVDAHNHPSQYSYTGTGYDLSIQQRLEMFKIPTEDKFADIETARTIYPKAVVCRFIAQYS
jgi:cytosine/adenosine deaminase-related metal-dependent hydrolase